MPWMNVALLAVAVVFGFLWWSRRSANRRARTR
jgi:nitrogen fixation-related uncharacterized protein